MRTTHLTCPVCNRIGDFSDCDSIDDHDWFYVYDNDHEEYLVCSQKCVKVFEKMMNGEIDVSSSLKGSRPKSRKLKMYRITWVQEESMYYNDGNVVYHDVYAASSEEEAWIGWFKDMGIWKRACKRFEKNENTWIPNNDEIDMIDEQAMEWEEYRIGIISRDIEEVTINDLVR